MYSNRDVTSSSALRAMKPEGVGISRKSGVR